MKCVLFTLSTGIRDQFVCSSHKQFALLGKGKALLRTDEWMIKWFLVTLSQVEAVRGL